MAKYIGAHVSASGGVENAPINAHEIGANTFAFFTKNQRQWKVKPLTDESIEGFKKNVADLGFDINMILPHASYLINLGNPDPEAMKKSYDAFYDEMYRCEQLGIRLLNFHPGSHLNKISKSDCLKQIADNMNEAISRTKGVIAVIENTAGQGTNLGFRFEHLAEIISHIDDKSRVGVCIDTAHALASGYDITTAEGYNATMEELDKVVGLKYLCGIHLNDSLKDLGTRVDRHAPLNEGVMGSTLFKEIMNDPRTNDMPIILETPKPEIWADEIKYLRGLIK